MTRVLSPADLDAAKAAGQPAVIGTIEGCHFMDGRLERIREVYRRGIRQLQIVHYMPSDLGDQQTENVTWDGLSPLGADVVRECNRLGIVVDVAHATFKLVEQTARLSAAPFIFSHTSLATAPLRRYSRLISADHARVMAQAGGVIGVWPAAFAFVDGRDWVAGSRDSWTWRVWTTWASAPTWRAASTKCGTTTPICPRWWTSSSVEGSARPRRPS